MCKVCLSRQSKFVMCKVCLSRQSKILCSLAILLSSPVLVRSFRVSPATSKQTSKIAVSDDTSVCPCWHDFSLKAEDCCERVDDGNLKGDTAKCAAKAAIEGRGLTPGNECQMYCWTNCFKVPHPNDKQAFLEYLGEKIGEVTQMGVADLLLARASWQAQAISSGSEPSYVEVNRIHALHPVGSWREDTWRKTLARRDGVLASIDKITKANGKLLKEDVNSDVVLKDMRSQNNFIAIPFAFNGITHVLLEGNGRMKGLQLAAQEAPDKLQNLKVEVDLLKFSDQALITSQEGILELWNQYVEEAFKMDRVSRADEFKEYASFAIAVVKCRGKYEGWAAPRSDCLVVNSQGEVTRTIPVGTPIGVQGKRMMPNGGTRYKLYPAPAYFRGETTVIGPDEYLLEGRDASDMVAWEYCRKCVRPLRNQPEVLGA